MLITIQKASLWKRISAWIFDIILTLTIAVGVAFVTSSVVKYDDYNAKMQSKYEQYEEKYGIEVDISQEDYEKLPQEIKDAYAIAEEAFRNDKEVQQLQVDLFSLSLLIVSVSAFLSIFIWYFTIPLLFGNGQTLGKKCFSIAVMRTNATKISNPVLFVRSILGLFAIETMVPALMLLMLIYGALGSMSLIVIGLICLLQAGVMLMTSTNSSIHDLLSDTVVVDMSSQLIFNSEDDLIAYKQMSAAKAAAEANGEEYTPISLYGNATYRADAKDEPSADTSTNEENNQDS